MRINRVRTVAMALAVAMGVASCGSGAGGGEADRSTGRSGKEAAAPARSEPEAASIGHQIISTADAVVRVADASRASDRAAAIAERYDGYVAAQEADLTGAGSSRLTLRVPSARFRTVLDGVTGLGREEQRTIATDEVTDEVVDLEGRLKSARASTDRLRVLLDQAAVTSDIVTLEGELAKRESAIEQMEGRLRVLSDQVALATIKVRFTEKAPPRVVEERGGIPGFIDSLRAGTGTLQRIGSVLLVGFGFVLPFLPFVVVGWLLVRLVRRRRPPRRMPPTPPGFFPPPSAPPPPV